MGILTPGGTRRWRGSDGWASVKGGGDGASLTRRCSGREGEERGAGMSSVEMAGGDGGDGALSRWWPVTEGEVKRRRHRLREGKGGGARAVSGSVRWGWPKAHDTAG
jgi:hypothetical protein